VCGRIDRGLLVYLGIGKGDTFQDLNYIVEKINHLRIFEDEDGKMNLSVAETTEAVLVVSQFTLFGDTRKGRRPSYSKAADPVQAKAMYQACIDALRQKGLRVAAGEFAARMEVAYTNLGPVTLILDSDKLF
jgi:D-tyrosyl-tRNA(Tyr) deacylase